MGPHSSASDIDPHATIDACDENRKPVRTLHVYLPSGMEEGELTPFDTPRRRAVMVSSLDINLHEMMAHYIAGMGSSAGC